MWFGRLWLSRFHRGYFEYMSSHLMRLLWTYNFVNTLFSVVFVALYFILNQNGSTSDVPLSAFPLWVKVVYFLIILALTLGWIIFFFTIHVSLVLYKMIYDRLHFLEREKLYITDLFKELESELTESVESGKSDELNGEKSKEDLENV